MATCKVDMMNKHQKSRCRKLLEVMEDVDLFSLARIITNRSIQGMARKEAIFDILSTIKTPEEVLQRQNMRKEYLVLYLTKNKVKASLKDSAADLRSRVLEIWGIKETSACNDPEASSSNAFNVGKNAGAKRKLEIPSMKAEKKKKIKDTDFKEKDSTTPSKKREYIVSVSFDFGTTFSGYAFSYRNTPTTIITNQSWVAGNETLMSLKTPTCILLDPGEEFVAFGYDAENKYSELLEDNLHRGYFFFQRFKMELYNREITNDMLIEDVCGRKLPAFHVFSLSIKHLCDHFWNSLETKGVTVMKTDVQYVLTVPAIWSDKAKQFMRKACTQAGIQSEQLRMALEPEAASVWCQTDFNESLLWATGSKYMVVDLGGGTADITVNEKMKDGTLKELHKASGGPWGGNEVDKAYINFLKKIFSEDIINEFKTNNMEDYFNLLRDFETKKRTINSSSEGKVTLRIPVSLIRLFERRGISLENWLNLSHFQGITSPSGTKLRVEKAIAKSWYDDALNRVTSFALDILQKPSLEDVPCILLVGGFAECDIVQDAFRQVLGEKRLVVPPEAGLFVLKGAVILGHKPELISVRRSKLTYGISVRPLFDDVIHRHDKKIKMFGKERCKDVFSKVVSIGDELDRNKEFTEEMYAMDVAQQTETVSVFCSDEEHPMYVTDAGCTFLGALEIDLPQTNTSEDKKYVISLIFWDTEIRVRVEIPKTKETYETTLDSI